MRASFTNAVVGARDQLLEMDTSESLVFTWVKRSQELVLTGEEKGVRRVPEFG